MKKLSEITQYRINDVEMSALVAILTAHPAMPNREYLDQETVQANGYWITRSGIAGVLRRLENRGYVVRHAPPLVPGQPDRVRPRRLYAVTDEGASAMSEWRKWQDNLMKKMARHKDWQYGRFRPYQEVPTAPAAVHSGPGGPTYDQGRWALAADGSKIPSPDLK